MSDQAEDRAFNCGCLLGGCLVPVFIFVTIGIYATLQWLLF